MEGSRRGAYFSKLRKYSSTPVYGDFKAADYEFIVSFIDLIMALTFQNYKKFQGDVSGS